MTRSALGLAALCAALLAAAPQAARAQDGVAPGARVRAYVVPPSVWRVGALERLTRDKLFLRPDGCTACAPLAIPRTAVTTLDVSAGRGGHPFRGMAIGLVAGAAVGAFVVARAVAAGAMAVTARGLTWASRPTGLPCPG